MSKYTFNDEVYLDDFELVGTVVGISDVVKAYTVRLPDGRVKIVYFDEVSDPDERRLESWAGTSDIEVVRSRLKENGTLR